VVVVAVAVVVVVVVAGAAGAVAHADLAKAIVLMKRGCGGRLRHLVLLLVFLAVVQGLCQEQDLQAHVVLHLRGRRGQSQRQEKEQERQRQREHHEQEQREEELAQL
jgi:hypothetical protein